MIIFALWLASTVVTARSNRGEAVTTEKMLRTPLALAIGGAGPLLLIVAGELIVSGARGIAVDFGISDCVIGATIVAVGTSIPELATALVAKWRGHDDIGLGTLLGSNIFNNLWIVPVAALIHPIDVELRQAGTALAFSILALLVALPPSSGIMGRDRGATLLLVYGCIPRTQVIPEPKCRRCVTTCSRSVRASPLQPITLFIGFVRADGSVSKITRDSRTFSFPASTLLRRKSVTMALDVTMDQTTDRISVGVLDPVSRSAGFASAFVAPRGEPGPAPVGR